MPTEPTLPLSPKQRKELLTAVIVSSIFGVVGYFTTKYIVALVNKAEAVVK